MKKIIILGILILTVISCKSQILPIEQAYIYYEDEDTSVPDNISYIKDVNNLLDKYVGTWLGTYDNKTYEIRIVQYTKYFLGRNKDKLLLRYKITDNTGNILVNTLNLSNNAGNVVEGRYLTEHGIYMLYYEGIESACGQHGDMYLDIVAPNYTTLRMSIYPGSEFINDIDCPNGGAEQIMPINFMDLVKQ